MPPIGMNGTPGPHIQPFSHLTFPVYKLEMIIRRRVAVIFERGNPDEVMEWDTLIAYGWEYKGQINLKIAIKNSPCCAIVSHRKRTGMNESIVYNLNRKEFS